MKYITPILETERLILKRGTLEDYEKVYEYDFKKLRNINGELSFERQDKNLIEGFDTYADETDEIFDWIIYLKNEDKPISNITADREEKNIQAIELAFNTHPNYWKKGYTIEAINKVLEFLYEYGFNNILCTYSEGNEKSKGICEKLGFELYEVKKDAWIKEGTAITDYKMVLSKEKFYSIQKKK